MDGTETPKPDVKDLGNAGRVDNTLKENTEISNPLIAEALRVGASRIYTWAVVGDEGIGWQTVSQKGNTWPAFREYEKDTAKHKAGINDEEMREFQNGGIKEFIIAKPLEVDIVEEKTVKKAQRGFFRTTYKETIEHQVVGKKAQLMSEIGGDTDSPAAAIYYGADDRYSLQAAYYDGGKRPGNAFNIKFILPLELAKQIAAEIEVSPKFIREMTAAFVEHNYPQVYIEKTWNTFGRPPYEKWDEDPKAALYFKNLLDSPDISSKTIKLKKD